MHFEKKITYDVLRFVIIYKRMLKTVIARDNKRRSFFYSGKKHGVKISIRRRLVKPEALDAKRRHKHYERLFKALYGENVREKNKEKIKKHKKR